MTVDGVDRGSATVAPMSITFSHATWDTVKTARLSVPMVALGRAAAWLEQFRSARDYCSTTVADATDAPREVPDQAPVEADLFREPACPSGCESCRRHGATTVSQQRGL